MMGGGGYYQVDYDIKKNISYTYIYVKVHMFRVIYYATRTLINWTKMFVTKLLVKECKFNFFGCVTEYTLVPQGD